MGLNFEDSDTTSPGTGHHLRRVARTTPPGPELETRTLPPRLRDKRSGGGGGLPNPTPRCSPAGDEKGVRPPWAAHNYLQDSGHCGRGASSIGRPSGTVGWPWNSRLESSGLTATRMDDTWPRSPADPARPGVARRPATHHPSQSTPALGGFHSRHSDRRPRPWNSLRLPRLEQCGRRARGLDDSEYRPGQPADSRRQTSPRRDLQARPDDSVTTQVAVAGPGGLGPARR